MIRDREPYPHPQFAAGLKAAGFDVTSHPFGTPSRDDVLLIWNRCGGRHQMAVQFEAAGAAVIVAENGWIWRDTKFYALCLGHHNGRGRWPVAGDDRWPLMGVDLKPWRERGKHIVVLGSRGIGEPGIAEPRGWAKDAAARLKTRTSRPVVLRPHPGDSHAPVDDAIANAHAVVTWGSGAAIKAIAAGVPAFHGLKGWIGADAARPFEHDLEDPFLGDRLPMFRRLAQAQFTAAEIATGAPLQRLLTSQSTA